MLLSRKPNRITDLNDLLKLKEFFIGVGFVTSFLVVILWLLGSFITPATALECLNVRTGEAGLAARGRGTTVVYAVVDTAGKAHYRTKASQFDCTAIYGKDWVNVGP